jgi:hypothetical protein
MLRLVCACSEWAIRFGLCINREGWGVIRRKLLPSHHRWPYLIWWVSRQIELLRKITSPRTSKAKRGSVNGLANGGDMNSEERML